jgi:hypothetical protein
MEAEARARTTLLMAQLEELWANFDELFASFGPDDWSRRHGPDWVFTDVPYHMYFFDQEFIADAIANGPDVPADRQVGIRTFRGMNAWSAGWFAKRPSDQTPQQSVAQYRASREAIRRAVAPLSDADLERPAWIGLVSTARLAHGGFCLVAVSDPYLERVGTTPVICATRDAETQPGAHARRAGRFGAHSTDIPGS